MERGELLSLLSWACFSGATPTERLVRPRVKRGGFRVRKYINPYQKRQRIDSGRASVGMAYLRQGLAGFLTTPAATQSPSPSMGLGRSLAVWAAQEDSKIFQDFRVQSPPMMQPHTPHTGSSPVCSWIFGHKTGVAGEPRWKNVVRLQMRVWKAPPLSKGDWPLDW